MFLARRRRGDPLLAIGLALSHYDARAHLVVSRRVFDSIVPGWQQIGAVWLPLPHLLDMVPVQIDVLYRTGAFAIALSVMCMAIAAGALAHDVIHGLDITTALRLDRVVPGDRIDRVLGAQTHEHQVLRRRPRRNSAGRRRP